MRDKYKVKRSRKRLSISGVEDIRIIWCYQFLACNKCLPRGKREGRWRGERRLGSSRFPGSSPAARVISNPTAAPSGRVAVHDFLMCLHPAPKNIASVREILTEGYCTLCKDSRLITSSDQNPFPIINFPSSQVYYGWGTSTAPKVNSKQISFKIVP